MPIHANSDEVSASSPEYQVPKDRLLGVKIDGFCIVRRIGKGGFGAIYLAEHVDDGSALALKFLWQHLQEDQAILERFRREALALSQIDHPHIVDVKDFGFLPGYGYYLAMEYLEGRSLREALQQEQGFPIARIQQIFGQLCSALSRIHGEGIIHRDLKPANVFLHRSQRFGERVKLLDFGIAALTKSSRQLTKSDASIGSPTYMSPEQARGHSRHVDARSDIYALGIILYELLTGSPPFRVEDGFGYLHLIHHHIHTTPPSLSERQPRVEWLPELEALLQAALAKEPDQRPADVASFSAEVQRLLQLQQGASQALPALVQADGSSDDSEQTVLDPETLQMSPSQQLAHTPSHITARGLPSGALEAASAPGPGGLRGGPAQATSMPQQESPEQWPVASGSRWATRVAWVLVVLLSGWGLYAFVALKAPRPKASLGPTLPTQGPQAPPKSPLAPPKRPLVLQPASSLPRPRATKATHPKKRRALRRRRRRRRLGRRQSRRRRSRRRQSRRRRRWSRPKRRWARPKPRRSRPKPRRSRPKPRPRDVFGLDAAP